MTKGNTLFLIICSNAKRRDGEGVYTSETGLANSLPSNVSADLLTTRGHILRLITQDTETRDDLMLIELPRNQNLVAGADFGGTAKIAQYLPSAYRYNGSFYRAIGSDASQLLTQTRYHILILSGLYGLLRPAELIQDYSCHVDDHPEIRPAWTNTRLLTDVLIAYLKTYAIDHVFDFTALDGYRQLINWNTLVRHGIKTWHAFGRQSVGDGFLTPLGELLGRWLREANNPEISQIISGTHAEVVTETESISFVRQDHPPEGFPREVSRQHQVTANKDETVRLARCLRYFLASIAQKTDLNNLDLVVEEHKRTGAIDVEIAAAMHRIIKRRNNVEHIANFNITPHALEEHRKDFRKVWQWAKQNDKLKSVSPECKDILIIGSIECNA